MEKGPVCLTRTKALLLKPRLWKCQMALTHQFDSKRASHALNVSKLIQSAWYLNSGKAQSHLQVTCITKPRNHSNFFVYLQKTKIKTMFSSVRIQKTRFAPLIRNFGMQAGTMPLWASLPSLLFCSRPCTSKHFYTQRHVPVSTWEDTLLLRGAYCRNASQGVGISVFCFFCICSHSLLLLHQHKVSPKFS